MYPSSDHKLDEILKRDEQYAEFMKIISNISNNLSKTSDIFSEEEQWCIFLSLYLSQCESIKSLFEDTIYNINNTLLPSEKYNLSRFVTLKPFTEIMQKYKKRKYEPLFSEIDVDLRNAIAHFNYAFNNDDIIYNAHQMSTIDLIFNFRKISVLFTILWAQNLSHLPVNMKI